MQIPVLSADQVTEKLKTLNPKRKYLAMYNSLLQGIVTEPSLMTVPVDDHIVHRGDGIFEAIKFSGRRIYALDRHLDRAQISAERVSLKMPFEQKQIREICIATTRAAIEATGAKQGLLRLFISRGPGGFSPNPYETFGSQLYLIITPFAPMSDEKYQGGVTGISSQIEVKSQFYAQVKSCNYLPNVMMKKEAVDRGVDFAIGVDERKAVAEGPTENFALVNHKNELIVPDFSRILRGVTLVRIMEFAEKMCDDFKAVRACTFTVDDIKSAKEAFMVGTTLDVISMVKFDQHPIGDGRPGPLSQKLRQVLEKDIAGETVLGFETLGLEI